MVINGATTTFSQVSEILRKLGIPLGALVPVGGTLGQVLTKLSAANYDTGWTTILGGIVTAGNGIAFAGNTIHFAQAAAYTAGAVPFATGVATMGFDAANLFWDAANTRLGLGTAVPADRLHAAQAYADVADHSLSQFVATTSVVGGTKRALLATLDTTGANNFNAGALNGARVHSLHGGAGTVTGALRTTGLEVLHGKNAAGTGNMDSTAGLYVQSVNLNVVGTIITTYDIYVATPTVTGTIVNNYAFWQASATAASYFAGVVSIGTATFNANTPLRIERAYASVADCYGTAAFMSNTAGADSAASHWGGLFRFTTAGGNNYTLASETVFGVDARAIHNGTGTCHTLSGVRAYCEKSNTGVVTAAYGGRFNLYNTNATGAIVTGYAMYAGTPIVTGAITTNYQCYLAAGAGTTSYGLASAGAADLNYFAGFSAFGSTAPVATTFALFGASTAAISSLRVTRGSAAYAGTVEGDFWNDFTQKCLIGYLSGMKQFDTRAVFVMTATQTITNTDAATTCFGAGLGSLTFPANFFTVGKTIRVTLRGTHTMDATPPSIIFTVTLGGVAFATVTYTDINDANQFIEISFVLTCRTAGAGGTGIGQGYILMSESTGASNSDFEQLVMTATAAMNTTAALALDVTADPSVADAGSSLTFTNGLVEVIA